MSDKKFKKPFSRSFVLGLTAMHIRECIDLSIRKTFERVSEFQEDPEKNKEIFQTLSDLHSMRKQIDDFQAANPEGFKGSKITKQSAECQ